MIVASIVLAGLLAGNAPGGQDATRYPIVAPTPTPDAGGGGGGGGAGDKAGTRRYCVIDSMTGSRIPKKICMTRKEWLGRGFDPLAPTS